MPVVLRSLTDSLRSVLELLRDVPVVVNEIAPALSSTRTILEEVRQSAHLTASDLEASTTRGQHSVQGLQQAATEASQHARSAQVDAQSAESSVRRLGETVAATETETRGRFTTITDGAASTSSAVATMSAQVTSAVAQAEVEVRAATQRIYLTAEEITRATLDQLLALTAGLREGSATIGEALDFLGDKTGGYIEVLRALVQQILAGQAPLDRLIALVKALQETLGRDSPLTNFAEELLNALETEYREGPN